MKNILVSTIFILLFPLLFISCGSQKRVNKFNTSPVSIKQFDTPPGADKSVSPELGGDGFKGTGWETKEDFNPEGNPKAVKGGTLNMSLKEFPITLRTEGKDANSEFAQMTADIIYESLLKLDPVNQDYFPSLATHWKLSDDKKTFTFRINPDARWADGKPVTTEDVLATYKLLIDPGILFPVSNVTWGAYEEPKIESKYIFSVKSKNLDWRQFHYFAASLKIYPAHYLKGISGKEYLEKYQFEFIPGSGPYVIDKKGIVTGQSITLRRRSDYWAEKDKSNFGLYNFDEIRFDVITDATLELEKFKKGEIDILPIKNAQTWEEKLNIEEVTLGLILKKKVYNEFPNGISGICLNLRKPPFDDIRIRRAMCYLYDRNKFNERLFLKSYIPLSSFFPGTVYENKNNPVIGFNLDSAAQLLSDAGYTTKNSGGYLTKDGKILEIDLKFTKGQDRYFTIFQEDLKKAGIKLNLQESDFNTLIKMGSELKFNAIPVAWMGTKIPSQENYFLSKFADSANTLNWSGIKNREIDSLTELFRITFSKDERIKILKEVDYIACNLFGYVFGWYAPYQRIVFHNKFGYPQGIISKMGNYYDVTYLWYYDPEKISDYDAAKKDNSKKLESGEMEEKFWLNNQSIK
jgi:microcin C transport system substrate-binding protein